MKYSLFVVFLFIGVSHGFFGSIGQAINNAGNTINQGVNEVGNAVNQVANETSNIATQVTNEIDNAKTQVENVVGQILNIANGIQFAARFLWDSVFSPAFDMMIQGRI
jgi:predicted PurR-regulated permease PerM